MRRTSLTTALYLLLLFFSGVAVGMFGHRLYTLNSVNATSVNPKNPDEYRRRYVAELRNRLKLTDDQVKSLQPILDETRKRYRDLHEQHRPQLKAIQEDQVRKIRALLSDDQQSEYTKMLEEREKLRQSGH